MSTHDRDEWPHVEHEGLWYKDLEKRIVYVHRPGRTMSEYDNLLFSTLSMNPAGAPCRLRLRGPVPAAV